MGSDPANGFLVYCDGMARPLRVEYPGSLYHVIARGNAKQDIFLNARDRVSFLNWLEEMVKMHNLICHAYCLMDNHYHLLLETIEANLSKAMHGLNGGYSQGFNVRHGRSGHLFQGRYKAFVIEKESYLLEVARYIVLNPVRAKLVGHPKQWKWSSYGATAGYAEPPKCFSPDWILGTFSSNRRSARAQYRRFVEMGIEGDDPYENVQHGFLLGTPEFVQLIWENCTNGSEEIKDYPREQRVVGRPTLPELFQDVTDHRERDKTIIFARFRCGYLVSEIARYIDLDPSVVGKISRGKYNSPNSSGKSR